MAVFSFIGYWTCILVLLIIFPRVALVIAAIRLENDFGIPAGDFLDGGGWKESLVMFTVLAFAAGAVFLDIRWNIMPIRKKLETLAGK